MTQWRLRRQSRAPAGLCYLAGDPEPHAFENTGLAEDLVIWAFGNRLRHEVWTGSSRATRPRRRVSADRNYVISDPSSSAPISTSGPRRRASPWTFHVRANRRITSSSRLQSAIPGGAPEHALVL